ncbi:MAG: TrmB family transcriptional regulator [Candidatus Thermoplasmatota archaeon]|jgi:sugar-specific transcriptional regulator TrmB|nr:TrmB family transcriptional regulator [Candidatus Thermoplasmatota archaeon]MCL5955735.1 TrmB family transcriptional regulator [Candidatus Thermoplasmatota archaeon]
MEANAEQLSKIAEMLKLLGLSSYEAQGFVALVYHGVANADTVADTANIPRTSAYKVMESLVQKGFAKETDGRPRMFKPDDMNRIRSDFQEKFDKLFRSLKDLQDMLPSKGEPQLVYTIYGNQQVMSKLAEMINLTEKELIICTPKVKEIRTDLKKYIDNAIKRGVKVTFVTPPNKRIPPNTQVFRKEGLIATDVVSDQIRAMLAGPEMDACGYTDNPALALHVYQFINMIIESEKSA